MQLSELTHALNQHPDAGLAFVLPDGSQVAQHFHVTEVGRVRKDFIDCGGTVRTNDACVLQVWVANDVDHRLEAGKLDKIIPLAKAFLKDDDLPVEIEYDVGVITQFAVDAIEASDEVITFKLAGKHTDCLAPDKCGIDGCADETDCCDPPTQAEPQEGSILSLGVQQDGCC
ncbi:MAG: DUF6428 family protein [Planctomycetota bacterium]